MISAFFFIVGVLILTLLYFTISMGIVTTFFWNWYVATAFNIPEIDFIHGFGIAMLVGILTKQGTVQTDKCDENKSSSGQLIGLIMAPWFVLLFGYIGKRLFL